jgi:hypothetical protein
VFYNKTMKRQNLLIILLIVFGTFVTAAVWPYWYNHIWSGFVLSDGSSYLSMELTQRLSTLLIVLPAFLALLIALLVSRKTNSKSLRIVAILFFSLFVLIVLLWIASTILIATHQPIAG